MLREGVVYDDLADGAGEGSSLRIRLRDMESAGLVEWFNFWVTKKASWEAAQAQRALERKTESPEMDMSQALS